MALFESKLEKGIAITILSSTLFLLFLLFYFGDSIERQETAEEEKWRELYDDISIERFFKGDVVVIVVEDKKTNKRYLGVKHFNLIEINNQEENNLLKRVSF